MLYPEPSSENHFFSKIEDSLSQEIPFCCFRKPNETKILGIQQKDDTLHKVSNFNERGFVFAPFDTDKPIPYIKADSTFATTYRNSKLQIENELLEVNSGKEDHIALVKKGIDAIEKGLFHKVVLSRKMSVSTEENAITIFKRLLDSYPEAFCYLFHDPRLGTWLGATPETLLHIHGNQLQTMSLAATLPYYEGQEPQWGKKEIEEQQMVTDYIKGKLEPFSLNITAEEVKSARAGKLWHLKSRIKSILKQATDRAAVIRALHPTPAVCGVPLEASKKFIKENEKYDRKFYTGFLGTLNLFSENEVALYVNLRCMELTKEQANVFIGGGITAASDPHAEWLETQNKSQTMLRVL